MVGLKVVFREVIVIGGGWLGLLVCKCMLEEGLIVVVLEKCFDVGGLWCYLEDFEIIIIM